MKRITSILLLFVVLLCLVNTYAMSESTASSNAMVDQQIKVVPRATKVISITFVKLKNTLRVGEQQRLEVDIKYTGTKPKRSDLSLYSKNPSVADIIDKENNGFWIEAYKTGKVTIIAECLGKSTSITLNITDYAPASVSLNKTKLTLEEGKTYTLKGTVLPKKANQKLTWTSSNKSVATVSSSGVVTGKAIGSATITAKTDNGLISKCVVTVNKKATPAPTPKPTPKPTPVPTPTANSKRVIIQIVTGNYHSLALMSNGDLYAWGLNEYGQLGDGTFINKNTPVFIGSGFTKIAAGVHYFLALKGNSLYTCGRNDFGQLGDGTIKNKKTPVFIGAGFTQVTAGVFHSLALRGDSLYAWGDNEYGQLGDGTYINENTPVYIGAGFTKTETGSYHSLALKGSSLYAWGENRCGELGDGTSRRRNTPVFIGNGFSHIAAGYIHSFALKGSSLYAWGWNYYGQLGDGTTIDKNTPVFIGTGFTQIDTGAYHTLALKGNSLYAWGENSYGQLGDGTNKNRDVPTCITFFD